MQVSRTHTGPTLLHSPGQRVELRVLYSVQQVEALYGGEVVVAQQGLQEQQLVQTAFVDVFGSEAVAHLDDLVQETVREGLEPLDELLIEVLIVEHLFGIAAIGGTAQELRHDAPI
jgi:hypothetical protein